MIGERDPRRDIFPRLDLTELWMLIKELPPPIASWKVKKVVFEVYKIKGLLSSRWPNEVLRRLLIDARGSYYIYGDRPPLDDYDDKAAIYFVRSSESLGATCYPKREEWISVRLVSPHGDPVGCGEIEMFMACGRPIGYLISKKLFSCADNFIFSLASSSRLCGLGPFLNDGESLRPDAGKKHQHTAISYAFIREQYFAELDRLRLDYKYLTGIIHNRLAEKALAVKLDGRVYSIDYTAAYKLLRLAEARCVYLDRRREDLCVYRYPTYWFDSEQFSKYVPKIDRLDKILLTKDGARLRKIIDRRVDDGPELKITAMTKVRRDIRWIFDIRHKP